MKRYFDFPDEKHTLQISVKASSSAAIATPEAIRDYFKQKGIVREIKNAEYVTLTKKYVEDAI